jgi:NRAMP (natural resistance-associated macrophage protein)-like metal ion transporter
VSSLHRNRVRARRARHFTRLGPGFVTGAADDDPSGIGTYSQVGAAFGFRLVWSALYVAPLAAAVQEMAARLGLVRGEGLAALIRQRFSRTILYGAVTLVAVANTFNIAADIAAMGASAKLVIPVPAALLAVLMTGVMLGLEIFVSYHRYARVLRWLALSLLAYLFVLATIDVDWSAVLDHALVPHLSGSRGELAALLAVFGTTVSPYLFFWQASEEVEEQDDRPGNEPSAPSDTNLRVMRWDVIGGMTSACVVAFSIMVSAAAALHTTGVTNIATADQAAEALKPFAGDLAGLVFALGVIGLGLLAVPVLAGSTAYAICEALHWNTGLSRRFRDAHGFYGVIVFSMVVGLLLSFGGIDPIRGLYYAAILNGIAAPPLIVLMVILARSDSMGARRSGRLSLALCCATIVLSVALPIAWLAS